MLFYRYINTNLKKIALRKNEVIELFLTTMKFKYLQLI